MVKETTNAKEWKLVFSDGSTGFSGNFPIGVCREQNGGQNEPMVDGGLIVDPIYDWRVRNNLYGRVMTLVEATTDPVRLKAVKDVFDKELRSWSDDVYRSAREKAHGGDSSTNLYNQ